MLIVPRKSGIIDLTVFLFNGLLFLKVVQGVSDERKAFVHQLVVAWLLNSATTMRCKVELSQKRKIIEEDIEKEPLERNILQNSKK